jgi:hypothetical protein
LEGVTCDRGGILGVVTMLLGVNYGTHNTPFESAFHGDHPPHFFIFLFTMTFFLVHSTPCMIRITTSFFFWGECALF